MSVSSQRRQGNGPSLFPAISGDGRFVAFVSDATNLVPGDTNGDRDVFVRVRSTNLTQIVSVGAGGGPADNLSAEPAVSRDGRYVAFDSAASNLVGGDTTACRTCSSATAPPGRRSSCPPGRAGTPTNRLSAAPDISENGQVVVFTSQLSDAGALTNVYRRNRTTAVTDLASPGLSGRPADGNSFGAAVSPDGLNVGFTSTAGNLVPGDTNNRQDVFVRH